MAKLQAELLLLVVGIAMVPFFRLMYGHPEIHPLTFLRHERVEIKLGKLAVFDTIYMAHIAGSGGEAHWSLRNLCSVHCRPYWWPHFARENV